MHLQIESCRDRKYRRTKDVRISDSGKLSMQACGNRKKKEDKSVLRLKFSCGDRGRIARPGDASGAGWSSIWLPSTWVAGTMSLITLTMTEE